jgi:AcrR family transcriptional regulator
MPVTELEALPMPMNDTSPRRQPRQSRSRDMVDAILDGALRAYTMASEQPSTNRIAELAGVSIGSLYQYFPGRTAIVAALVRRRVRQINERLLEVVEQSSQLSLEEGVARFVDCMFNMKLAQLAGDRAIIREALRHAMSDEAFESDAELVARFSLALDRWKPTVRSDLPGEIAALVLFQGLRAAMVLGTASRPDIIADERTRDEVKRLLVSYLKPA